MCGIFGFVGRSPNIDKLQEIGLLAGTRGMHSWGVAYLSDEKVHSRIGAGLIEKHLGVLKQIRNNTFIGHCRLGTIGSFADLENSQPIQIGSIASGHNGNIYNYLDLAKTYNIKLEKTVDSEIIPQLLSKGVTTHELVNMIESPFAICVITPAGVEIMRYSLPIFVEKTEEGIYFCSRKFGNATKINEREVYNLGKT